MIASEDIRNEIDDASALLDLAAALEDEADFGDGDDAFRVRLRICSRRELDEIGKAAQSKRLDRNGNRIYGDEEQKRFRIALRDKCILGWSDLTVRKMLAGCSKSLNGNGTDADKVLKFTPRNVLLMLENARGHNVESDRTVGFDDWVFEQATKLAGKKIAQETAEKNG